MHRWLKIGLFGAVGGAVAVQLVPYGRDHDDGRPVLLDWPSVEAAEAFDAACADCHTEQTDWPWYSNVAPMSWLVQRDVDRGRDAWNLSAEVDDLHDAAEEVEDGSMPPFTYELAHPDARLSGEEEAALIAALESLDEGAEAAEEEAEEAEDAAEEEADEPEEPDDGDSSGRGRGRGRGGSNSGPG